MSTPILEAHALQRTFGRSGWLGRRREPIHAVADVNLTLMQRESLAIVGESGSGKTTLANLLLGLDKPSSGAVLLDGRPLADLSRQARAKRIQPVFQNPMLALNPRRRIGDIIAEPLVVHGGHSTAERRRKVDAIMEATGLPSRLYETFASELSGGQKQRVAIARALILGTDIVLCDEPTSALDVSIQAQILNLLIELREAYALTLIFITHDLSVAEFICDRVMIMQAGRVVEEGAIGAVFDRPRQAYTRRLLDAMPVLDLAAGRHSA